MGSLENPFILVEEGGIRIIVTHKSNRIFGMVSPYAMALASPVWKKFIFPPFRQMPPNSHTAVFLERVATTKNIDDPVFLETAGTTESSEPVVPEKIATLKLGASNPSVEPTKEIDFAEDPPEALLNTPQYHTFSIYYGPTDNPIAYFIRYRYPLRSI
jgi:hypothetical protein